MAACARPRRQVAARERVVGKVRALASGTITGRTPSLRQLERDDTPPSGSACRARRRARAPCRPAAQARRPVCSRHDDLAVSPSSPRACRGRRTCARRSSGPVGGTRGWSSRVGAGWMDEISRPQDRAGPAQRGDPGSGAVQLVTEVRPPPAWAAAAENTARRRRNTPCPRGRARFSRPATGRQASAPLKWRASTASQRGGVVLHLTIITYWVSAVHGDPWSHPEVKWSEGARGRARSAGALARVLTQPVVAL